MSTPPTNRRFSTASGPYSFEIFEDLPEVDTIIVPIGAGSGACGAITVVQAVNPDVKVIGVQAENAPSVYRSWKAGEKIETDSANTVADGLATRVTFDLPFSILKRWDQPDDVGE